MNKSTLEQDIEKDLPRVTSEDKSGLAILSNPTYQYIGIAALVVIVLGIYYAM